MLETSRLASLHAHIWLRANEIYIRDSRKVLTLVCAITVLERTGEVQRVLVFLAFKLSFLVAGYARLLNLSR